jgi:FKBP-type peptidyl-prolyl cis-trans isomerase FkpA
VSALLARIAVVLVLSLAAAGCDDDSPTAPSNNASFAITDLREGTGATAGSGSVLVVHYTGWFYDASQANQKGPQFDSSIGGTPFAFTLGAGQVISGWDAGLVGMKAGGLRRLIIPPSLGYGSVRNGPIPPNASLLFEVDLIEVQ